MSGAKDDKTLFANKLKESYNSKALTIREDLRLCDLDETGIHHFVGCTSKLSIGW